LFFGAGVSLLIGPRSLYKAIVIQPPENPVPHTVGRAIVDSLEAHDIDIVYCVPGESYLGFTNAMAGNNRMRLIVCRHEGGAAFMAALRPTRYFS